LWGAVESSQDSLERYGVYVVMSCFRGGRLCFAMLLCGLFFTSACRGQDDAPAQVAVVRDSSDPSRVADDVTSVTGKVVDLFSGEAVDNAWLSTFPVSDAVRARPDGQYILERDLIPDQLYTVTSEANGYAPASAPVLVKRGKSRNVDLLMIPTERALPVLLDPPAIAMPPNINRVRVEMRANSQLEEDADWSITSKPDWLLAEPTEGVISPDGLQILRFALDPEPYQEALQTIDAGESLWGEVRLEDTRERLAVLPVLVVPANLAQISLDGTLETGQDDTVTVGDKISLVVVARLGEAEFEGAPLRVQITGNDGGLVSRQQQITTDDRGLAVIDFDAELEGSYQIDVRMATYPNVDPVNVAVTILPSGVCAVDNGGCGEPSLVRCVDDDGVARCEDIDECAVDAAGFNACGRASRYRCVNNNAAPPTCEDVDECLEDNGGCGDPRFFRCENREGASPSCEDIAECDVDNGGCGDAAFVRCVEQEGASPVCEDIDNCSPGADGMNSCGLAVEWECTDNDRAAPTCVDIDSCTPGPDGLTACGDPAFSICVEGMGAPPTCMDTEDECATSNGGCGSSMFATCVNNIGAPHECEDVDECAVNNGGCGDPMLFECVNNLYAPATCLERDPCAPNANGLNICGVAARWVCDAADPNNMCMDRDECALDTRGNNECGKGDMWTCTNNLGAPPTCVDIDECATANGGCDPLYDVCQNNPGAIPTCLDFDECSVANGGCDPTFFDCVNQDGADPICVDRDECVPDAMGMTPCGDPAYSLCIDQVQASPVCQDIDECQLDNGANACGDPARMFLCTNNDLAAPTCAACMPGEINLDNDPSNGCEYLCSNPVAEACNSLDDDCDGLVDEDFELASDVNNCGACGVACGSLANARATSCVAGACVVIQCEPGYRDADRDDSNGCEVAPDPNATIWFVDQFAGNPGAAGTEQDPLNTLLEAYGLAADGDTILVEQGVYQEVLVIHKDIDIIGVSRETVVIHQPSFTNYALRVDADDVTLSNLTITGGEVGIYSVGSVNLTLRDLAIAGQQGAAFTSCTNGGPGRPAYGIDILNGESVSLVNVDVSSVAGADGSRGCCSGCAGSAAGESVGIRLRSVAGGIITGGSLTNITSGAGGRSQGCGGSGRAGGVGYGVLLDNSTGVRVEGVTFSSITGGRGGNGGGGCSGGAGANGGIGAAIRIIDGGSHFIRDNTIGNIVGGKGGSSFNGKPGSDGSVGFGIFDDSGNLVTIERNVIREIFGGDAGDIDGGSLGSVGAGMAIRASNAANVTIRNNSAWFVRTGLGGTSAGAYCVRIDSVNPATIQHLTCSDVAYQTASVGFGVRSFGSGNGVTIENSIFDRVQGTCVKNDDLQSTMEVSYSNFNLCSTADIDNALTRGFIYNDPPGLALDPPGNTSLLPTSTLIDAGDPGSSYENEPSPNGCKVNLGAFGNTPLATAAPNAMHCN